MSGLYLISCFLGGLILNKLISDSFENAYIFGFLFGGISLAGFVKIFC